MREHMQKNSIYMCIESLPNMAKMDRIYYPLASRNTAPINNISSKETDPHIFSAFPCPFFSLSC